MPPTLSLEAGMPIVNQIREILLKHPEVITVVSQHGRPDNGSDASPFSNVELFAPLKPFDEWPSGLTKEKLTEELQKEFSEELPGIGFNFSQYIQDNVEEGLSGVKGANSIKIVGPDLTTLEKIAKDAMEEMSKVPGITDLGVFWVLGQPNLNIKIDREKAAMMQTERALPLLVGQLLVHERLQAAKNRPLRRRDHVGHEAPSG